MKLVDPVQFTKLCWPDVTLTREQREIMYSVRDDDETFVPAGNMLGKDFVAGLTALWFFVSRHPCRIVTTSVDHTQLEAVLWGEIRRFIQTSNYPLPLIVNHLHLRKLIKGQVDGLSYLIGRVAAKGEGFLGHHIAETGDKIPRTLFIVDEASGVDDESFSVSDTWARRKLVIGNPYPCENFFKKGVKAGSQPRDENDPSKGFHRRVIRIKAEDSPNVRLAQAQIKAGQEPTGEVIVPGVKSWPEYVKNRKLWDKIRQCIGLDAEFYEGAEVLLYPPDWLNRAETIAAGLHRNRQAKAIGIDPAEGGDSTAMAAVDELGLIELVSKKTPDTAIITSEALAFMTRHGVPPEMTMFDRGGGGKQHADRLRQQGYNVRTVAFGESSKPERKRGGITPLDTAIKQDETRYIYKNRRAEMYGRLRIRLDPSNERYAVPSQSLAIGWGIPAEYTELRRQLSPIPLAYDEEGRLELPPKHRKNPNDTRTTLTELIGCSPDEADAVVIGLYCMETKGARRIAGVAF